MELTPIAHFHSPFTSKFGIPKQSGLVEELEGEIIFEPAFRNADYLRGIESFDYLWLIWEFSANPHGASSPLVRPPRLGGNEKVGVFASRSPFRPNPLGLSCVRLKRVEWKTERGPLLHIGGADLMNGTPIYDIKPYITYADARPEAKSGFVDTHLLQTLFVVFPPEAFVIFTVEKLIALEKTLSQDPRPHYHDDATKTYGMPFAGYDIRFQVDGRKLTVVEIKPLEASPRQ